MRTLGLDDEEKPHSLRTGCAVTLPLSDVDSRQLMSHVGWSKTEIRDAREIALTFAQAKRVNKTEATLNDNCDFSQIRSVV